MKTLLSIAIVLLTGSVAAAEVPATLHADVELDPTAYALDGDSVHVGVGVGRWRVDLGNFAERLPQFVHGDDGFDVSFAGWGVKLQAFASDDQRGWFAGVDAGLLRVTAHRQGGDLATSYHVFGAGLHAGYRIELPHDFYVTPWLGLGYQFGSKDVTLDNATTKAMPVSVFPAVHVGFRFR